MRIYRHKYYILATIPGISGFQRWNEREYRVVNGVRASSRFDRLDVVKEFLFNGGRFQLENGRLPEHQPITGQIGELYPHLDHHGSALILTPEAYGLTTVVRERQCNT